jgi:hypothetical protein
MAKRKTKTGKKTATATSASAYERRADARHASHEVRLQTLEREIGRLKASSTFKAADAAQTVDMTFTLDDSATSAKFARVYLEGDPNNDIANNLGKRKGVLKGQQVGSQINVVVDVAGSDSGTGAFTVTHGNPSHISVTVQDGPVSDQPIDVI